MGEKIKSLSELKEIVSSLKNDGKKIVHCHGVFDFFHPGHLEHLEEAKKKGDVLIVTVTPDQFVDKGPDRPYFSQDLRAKVLASLECVDYIAINEFPTAENTIHILKPDFYVKGNEFVKQDDPTGKIQREIEALKKVGGSIHYTNGITFSSSKIINLFSDLYPEETQRYLKEFSKKYFSRDIIKKLKDLENLKILVIGDTIIDEYCYVETLDRPPKETMLAVKCLEEEKFAGATLASANHIAGFCKNVHLVTCLGKQNKENYELFIKEHLKKNISQTFFYRDDAPTVVKRRYIDKSFLRKMFEICIVENKSLIEAEEDEIVDYLNKELYKYDVVVVSDFGHGFIGEKMIKVLCEKSKFLAVSTQTNECNMGFNLITKYPKADYVCIDEPELRLAMHDKDKSLRDLVRNLLNQKPYGKILITRGHCGALAYDPKEGFNEAPIFSGKKVVDTIGAGDAVFSVTAPYVSMGNLMETVLFVGNVAGAIAVNYIGNKESVEPDALFKFISTLLK